MDNDYKFLSHLDPEKADKNAQVIAEIMSKAQKHFLDLYSLPNTSIVRTLDSVDKQLAKEEGKSLIQVVKLYSDQNPELKILPIFLSLVSKFHKAYPLEAIREYIKDKSEALEKRDFNQPENKFFSKVESVDWRGIDAFMEDHFFIYSLLIAIEKHHPNFEQEILNFKEGILSIFKNYKELKEKPPGSSSTSTFTYKTKKNKSVNYKINADLHKLMVDAMIGYIADMHQRSKDLAFNEDLSLNTFEEILNDDVERFLKTKKTRPLKKVILETMLQKLLEFIAIKGHHQNAKYIICHDLIKILYPGNLTPDIKFLKDGPIYNDSGSMDPDVWQKKLREVKILMGFTVNG